MLFINKNSAYANKFWYQSYGDTIQDQKLVEKILWSLPQKFDHVVAKIEESKDLSVLTMYELMGSLKAHKGRMSRFSS